MVLSDEKISHVIHLILTGLKKEGLLTFVDKERATRQARKVFVEHFKQIDKIAELARNRILTQKNHPPEHSPQWENLYQKYYEEELRRHSGGE